MPLRSVTGHIVMPGLVNCHTHLGNGFLRGLYDEMPLEVWFSKGMWPVLDSMNRTLGEAGASLSLLELMTSGVTTTASGEICSPSREVFDGVVSAVRRSGIRAILSRIVAMHALSLETGGLFTMHVGSSQDERDESQRRFGHGSVTELNRLGVLGPRTLLAHAIWLDDAEVDFLAGSRRVSRTIRLRTLIMRPA